MKQISSKQNLSRNIERLAAQRYFYSRAKKLSVVQITLAVLISFVGFFFHIFGMEVQLIAFLGIFVSFLNIGLLERLQNSSRRNAADIQEEFDCDVLGLEWNAVLVPYRPAVEVVKERARSAKSESDSSLKNWYPTVVDSVKIHQSRVICQRINCQLNSKLVHQLGWSLWILFSLVVVGAAVFGIYNNISMQKFVLALAAPLSPTLLWLMREAQRFNDAASAIDQLIVIVDIVWTEIQNNSLTEKQAKNRSRELQNVILNFRRVNPPVYSWFYLLSRQKSEREIENRARFMVEQLTGPSEAD